MNIKDFILGYLIGKNDGGGGASVEPLTVTENGEYSEEGVAYSPVTVNVSGGLEYEEGTWSPSENTSTGSISFANQHSVAPLFWAIYDDGENATLTANSMTQEVFIDIGQISSNGIPSDPASVKRNYGVVVKTYATSSSLVNQNTSLKYPSTEPYDYNDNYPYYWCDSTSIKLHSHNSTQLWRTGRTYKWIAVWAPTA